MAFDGVVNVLKPPGMTSHDVVAWVRRRTGVRRVGHAGTLDPGAVGVLLVCVGRATRLAEYLSGARKDYLAEITFGTATDTDDRWGNPTASGRTNLSAPEVDGVLPGFRGRIHQVPPTVSALKHRGKALYQWAREGKPVVKDARPVNIYDLERLGWQQDPPRTMIRVSCSSGTYVRALCRDLGQKLESAAHMSFLLRCAVGPHQVNDSWTLEELAKEPDACHRAAMDMGEAVAWLPSVTVSNSRDVSRGHSPPLLDDRPPGELVRLYDSGGRFLAVARADPDRGRLKLEKVFIDSE